MHTGLTSAARAAWLALVLMLAGCAASPPRVRVELPALRLAPAALGTELALQQRLRFVFGAEQRELDALLEVDAASVRLAVQALGRPGVRLVWDGTTLQQQRAEWLPDAVRGERVLDDLQFVHWPPEAIRAALPAGWSVEASDRERTLRRGGTVWLRATFGAHGEVELDNRAMGYRLFARSTPLAFSPAATDACRDAARHRPQASAPERCGDV